MSLITYVLTSEYVVLASDRRLTFVDGRGRVMRQEDLATKTFVLWGQMIMGFTGIALLDGKPLELWATERLAGVTANEAPQALAQEMDNYYARHPEVRKHAHHFQAVGFGLDRTRLDFTIPTGFGVGNTTWGLRGDKVSSSGAQSTFQVSHNVFGNQGPVVSAVGSPYSLRQLRELRKKVVMAVRANAYEPSYVFEPMVDFTRATAARSDGTVGDVVTVVSLPRVGVPFQQMGVSIPLTADYSFARNQPFSHTYYPDDAADRVEFMPASVHHGMAMAGGTVARGETMVTPSGFEKL